MTQPPRVLDEAARTRPRASYGPAPPPPSESVDGWPPGENCMFALVDGRHQSRLTIARRRRHRRRDCSGTADRRSVVSRRGRTATDSMRTCCGYAACDSRFESRPRSRRCEVRSGCCSHGAAGPRRRTLRARSRDSARRDAAQSEPAALSAMMARSNSRNPEPKARSPGANDGVALDLVLLVMVTLSALATSLALLVSTESRVTVELPRRHRTSSMVQRPPSSACCPIWQRSLTSIVCSPVGRSRRSPTVPPGCEDCRTRRSRICTRSRRC